MYVRLYGTIFVILLNKKPKKKEKHDLEICIAYFLSDLWVDNQSYFLINHSVSQPVNNAFKVKLKQINNDRLWRMKQMNGIA